MPTDAQQKTASQSPAVVVAQGEGAAATAGCTARRHDASRAAYQAGCRCPAAVEANRDYYRDYNRRGRQIAAWRQRQNEHARRYQQRLRAEAIDELNARRREQAKRRRERLHADAQLDPVAIERYLNGDRTIRLTRVEKATALRQLLAKGSTLSAAGERLGMNGQSVRKYAAMTEVAS